MGGVANVGAWVREGRGSKFDMSGGAVLVCQLLALVKKWRG